MHARFDFERVLESTRSNTPPSARGPVGGEDFNSSANLSRAIVKAV